MEAFPLFLKLAGRVCLVVGANAAGLSKAEMLLRCGAVVIVATDDLPPALAEWRDAGKVSICHPDEAEARLPACALAIVAGAPDALARRLAAAAEIERVPFVALDRPEISRASMGAIVDRSPFIVAIASGGAAPVLARSVRQSIERMLPPRLGRLAVFAAGFRSTVHDAIGDAKTRAEFWNRVFTGAVADQVLAGDETGAARSFAQLLSKDGGQGGIVHIVGAGPGDPDLLTLRAHDLLGRADLILHDRGMAPAILDRARREAALEITGEQAPIKDRLLAEARTGKRVVLLVAGDARAVVAVEDVIALLRSHSVPVEVVPGVPDI